MLDYTMSTWADGFGRWRARIEVPPTASYPKINLYHHRAMLRQMARKAILHELVDREQTTYETREAATKRINVALPDLQVIDQERTPQNTWTSVTFGE